MANILDLTKLIYNTRRNGFDLSERLATSAKVGECLPIYCAEVLPDDDWKIITKHFTRTMPLNTAAFTRVQEYMDYYFVPTNLLWDKFNTWFMQLNEQNTKAIGINGNATLTEDGPYFSTYQMYSAIYRMAQGNYKNFFGYDRATLACKVLHHLGYGDFYGALTEPSMPGTAQNANLCPFPLLAYQKVVQDYIRNSQWQNAYAPSYNINYISGASGTLNVPLDDLDLSVEGMLDIAYSDWNKDMFMGLLPNSQFGDAAEVDIDTIYASTRVFDTPIYLTSTTNTAPASGSNINTGSQLSSPQNSSYLNADGLPQKLVLTPGYLSVLRERMGLDDSSSSFTILALRLAESVQQLKEIRHSRKQDVKDQMKAIWNVNIDESMSDRSHWIGGSKSVLDISEVVNQNLADNNAAEIAGKGVGVGQGVVNFRSKIHGYIIGIYHATPLLDYANSGIDRKCLKTKITDFANPVLDHTGMVSLPAVELTNSNTNISLLGKYLGYLPRYYDYKMSYDKVRGAFYNGGANLENWVAPITDSYIKNYVNSLGSLGDISIINYWWMKVNPSILNPIFASDADSTVDTDQLLLNIGIDAKAVRNLDRDGLPY